MATWLKQSTAVEIKLGPFVDSGDGATVEDGLTISQADVRLAKNGGDWAQKNESTTLVHEENGWYRCLLDTTDTNTLGILVVNVNESGALQVWREFMVLPANVYDSLVSTDLLQVDAREWLGGTIATPTQTGVPEVDVTHWIGTAAATPTTAGVPEVDVTHLNGVAQSLQDLKDFADDGYDPSTNMILGISGTKNQLDDLNDLSAAAVNAEVVDALNVDTYAEPGQGNPAATASLTTKIGFLYKAWRNKKTQTASEFALFADDGSTKDQEAGVSDDGSTFTQNEMQTGA